MKYLVGICMKTILWGDMYDKKDKCGGNCGHYVGEHDVHYSFGRRFLCS